MTRNALGAAGAVSFHQRRQKSNRLAVCLVAATAALAVMQPAPAVAAVLSGQIDEFQDGGLANWEAGVSNPNGPANISSGGPSGINDRYLQLTANGGFAGGRLVAFNAAQWTGDYLAGGVSAISADVNNLGSTDLVLRLILLDSLGNNLTTSSPINVAAGSGWQQVSFSLAAGNLTGSGSYGSLMGNVAELDLVHSPSVISSRSLAPKIVAQLGVDNVAAISATDVTWTGVGSTTWDTIAGSNNWKKTGDGTSADYSDGAHATFNDTATGTAVNIAADVSPAGVVFNNTSKSFLVTGSAGITGATAAMKKRGSGTVTIGSVNSYGGTTSVEAGRLVLQGRNKAMKPVLDSGGADIRGGMLVLDYTGETDPAATVNSLITTSYNAAGPSHFNTGKFQSSTADATHGLGWIDNTATSKISVAYTIYGDADLNGAVGLSDLGKVLTNWGIGSKWSDGDVDYNAAVGLSDLGKVLTNWGLSVGTLTPAAVGQAVPEPSILAMLVAAACMAGARFIRRAVW